MRGLAVRPSWYPKYVPKAGDGCVLFCPGQDDPQSAVLRDISGNRNNGTITGATWVRLPSGLWVLSYDGTDDKVTIADHASLDITTALTLEAWVYHDISGDEFPIAKRVGGGDDSYEFRIAALDNPAFSVFIGDVNKTAYHASTVPVLTWAHLVGTFDGASVRLYVNGTPGDAVEAIGSIDVTTDALTIGWGYSNDYAWDGKVALPCVRSRALSSSEVLTRFNQTRHLFGV